MDSDVKVPRYSVYLSRLEHFLARFGSDWKGRWGVFSKVIGDSIEILGHGLETDPRVRVRWAPSSFAFITRCSKWSAAQYLSNQLDFLQTGKISPERGLGGGKMRVCLGPWLWARRFMRSLNVQFVKHIVLTSPINLSYCHRYSYFLLNLCSSYFSSVCTPAFIFATYCIYIRLLCTCLTLCVCVYWCLCACVCVRLCVCMCVCVSVINTQQMVQSGHSSSSQGKKVRRCTERHSRQKNWAEKGSENISPHSWPIHRVTNLKWDLQQITL